ncbi:ComEA family DNA-binding protein [Bifidobacterium saimiriisciurei]|uniref:Helix-hairpin-helix domain-containing protein n=1 Tax=Bifidobacterium saimiriisciurei TaxID=2661627 RepID=A0ABX0C8F9_9BIFI|nr:helix-hairpin-helix domain-containing protein [Bifidobacterium saimiriisciurei]NEH10875.1 helix-hairpin-helix domain-containing protein [Bifidobacterium saimiriisciurei]
MGAASSGPLPYLPVTAVPLPPDLGVESVDDSDAVAPSGPSTLLSTLAGVDRDDAGADALLERRSSRDATRLMLDGRRSAAIILILVLMLSASLTMLIQQSGHLADSSVPEGLAAGQTSATASPKRSASARESSPSASASDAPAPSQSPSPTPTVPSSSPSISSGGPSSNASGLIDLNTATAEQLDTINGIGPVTAQRILDHRARNGRFTSVDELLDVQGIGSKTLEKIRPYVTVGS